jgi:hypothetical protein
VPPFVPPRGWPLSCLLRHPSTIIILDPLPHASWAQWLLAHSRDWRSVVHLPAPVNRPSRATLLPVEPYPAMGDVLGAVSRPTLITALAPSATAHPFLTHLPVYPAARSEALAYAAANSRVTPNQLGAHAHSLTAIHLGGPDLVRPVRVGAGRLADPVWLNGKNAPYAFAMGTPAPKALIT